MAEAFVVRPRAGSSMLDAHARRAREQSGAENAVWSTVAPWATQATDGVRASRDVLPETGVDVPGRRAESGAGDVADLGDTRGSVGGSASRETGWVPAPRPRSRSPVDSSADSPLAPQETSSPRVDNVVAGVVPARERADVLASRTVADAEAVAGGSGEARYAEHPVLGPLAEYLDDPAVTDVLVNGSAGLFVDRGEGAIDVPQWRAGEREVRDLAVALIGMGGRHIDDASPCVDVRLADGLRIHAVLPPVAPAGTTISIRVPGRKIATLDALERGGLFDADTRIRLESMVARRENFLVTGAAGAGKTTLLAAMLGRAGANERIITIEDVAELRIDHPHHVRLEARQPNLEGVGGIDLARPLREALRMRPDRLVVLG